MSRLSAIRDAVVLRVSRRRSHHEKHGCTQRRCRGSDYVRRFHLRLSVMNCERCPHRIPQARNRVEAHARGNKRGALPRNAAVRNTAML